MEVDVGMWSLVTLLDLEFGLYQERNKRPIVRLERGELQPYQPDLGSLPPKTKAVAISEAWWRAAESFAWADCLPLFLSYVHARVPLEREHCVNGTLVSFQDC